MELKQFEKAKEIKEELDVLLRLSSFCRNDSTHITLCKLDSSNEWVEMKLIKSIKEIALDCIDDIIKKRIIELENQFKEL